MMKPNANENTNELLSIIMPFHNEEATLKEIVSRVLSTPLPIPLELILVDDGSTDSSSKNVGSFLSDKRVKYFRSAYRTGKGAAVCRGISQSQGTILLIQDADLEYDPKDYCRPLSLILDGTCDFALGSRVLGAGHWAKVHNIRDKALYCLALNTGSMLLTLILRAFFRVPVTDPTTMLKVFRRECLSGITFESLGFEWDWEILCKLLRKGRIPIEVPISYSARTPGEGKKLNMCRDGWGALVAIVKFYFYLRSPRIVPQAKQHREPQY